MCFGIRRNDEDFPSRPPRHGRRGGGGWGNTGYTNNGAGDGAGHVSMPPQDNNQPPADEAARKASCYDAALGGGGARKDHYSHASAADGGGGHAQGKVDDETKLTQQPKVPAWQQNKAGEAAPDDHHKEKPMDLHHYPNPTTPATTTTLESQSIPSAA